MNSALADANARGIGRVCVFFSHLAAPDLLARALANPHVAAVGTKDLYPESQLPPILRDHPRVGRYWEPGAWRLPEGAAHIYFIGPWRLLTAAMLREAIRADTKTLRCRVMTNWRTVPLHGARSLSGFARKSGFATVASGASFAGRLVAGAPRAAVGVGRKVAVIRSTLFIRHLDTLPETLVASALADADGRGVDRVTIFFSHVVEPEILGKLLEDRRVASVGTKDARFESLLPPALLSDPRVGRYWEPGNWTLPEPAEHVYFVGPWRLITPEMIGHALRRDVASLRVRVATSWATVPLTRIRSGLPLLRFIGRTAGPVNQLAKRAVGASRRLAAQAILAARSDWAETAARIAGPNEIASPSLERVFKHMLRNRPASVQPVSGRIVLVCGNLAPGGAERQVTYTLQGLAARRLDVSLLCHHLAPVGGHRYDFYLPQVEAAGVSAREVSRRVGVGDSADMPSGLKEVARLLPPALAADIANLCHEFRELRPEVVHTWLDWDNVRGGLAAALAGVPRVVVSGRNINPSNFALYQPYMDPAYRVLAGLPNVTLINNSRAGADDYADWLGIPSERIGVVHNAVDFAGRNRLPPEGRAALRASLRIPEDAFLVGGVFRLEAEKRPLLWVETAALLARQVPNMHFVIFGQGSMRDELLRAAERQEIAGRLTLAGVTSDVLSAMSIMDVFLLASFGEGLPNVLLEAQWVGTPVVLTDVGGAKEAVEPGVTGWPIPTNLAWELATKIKWLFDNVAILEAARRRGPEWVRDQFGVDRMLADTLKAYALSHLIAAQSPEEAAAGHASESRAVGLVPVPPHASKRDGRKLHDVA